MYCKSCKWCAEKVGEINFWSNIGLLVLKLCGGIFGRSQALMADAFHSMNDIIVALLLLLGIKVTNIPPDKEHPWGHGHIEFIVSLVIGIILIFVAITITTIALVSIIKREITQPTIVAVWAALISVIANDMLARHSFCIGRQLDSPVLISNALENRADSYTSGVALIGAFGARLGFYMLDPLAAIGVGFFVARSGIRILTIAFRGIADYSLDSRILNDIQKIAFKNEGIKGVGEIKGRKIGQKKWLDMEIAFDAEITVAETKKISDQLRKSIGDNIERIGGINIKVIPTSQS